MKRCAILTVLVLGLIVACGGTSPSSGVGTDAGLEASSPPDGGDAALDGASADGAQPDVKDAGRTCAMAGTASKCIICCQDAFPGSGAELVFFQECELCGAFCSGKAPCGPNGALAADAGCVSCLSPKLVPGASGWTQCQQSTSCKGFVACFATCPTI